MPTGLLVSPSEEIAGLGFYCDGVKHGPLGIETVIPFPKSANSALAPVEDIVKLSLVMVFANHLICVCCASAHGFGDFLAVTRAQPLAQRESTGVKMVINR